MKTDKEKAEEAFDKWWRKEDRYAYPIQCAWPEAYIAGLRAGRRESERERKRDLLNRLKKKGKKT